MTASPSLTLLDHFATLDDPRADDTRGTLPRGTRLHPLVSIITIAIRAAISGAESWDDIEQFGEAREEWTPKLLRSTVPALPRPTP